LKIKYLFQTLLLLVLIGSPSLALARTATWDGGGSGNLASTAGNWDTDVAPIAGDAIVFDATSTKACTWDISSATTFASFSINAGAQAITLNNSLNLTGAYNQASGTMTFNTGSPIITAGADSTISGGTVTQTQEPNGSGTTAVRAVSFNITGNLNYSAGSITVDSLGFPANQGPGKNNTGGDAGGANGGDGANGAYYHSAYAYSGFGSISAPVTAGSGGQDAAGGGVVRLNVSGTLTVTGIISANGAACVCSEGAGGSIWLSAGTLAGSGTIRANGGNNTSGNPGGGGKISLTYTTRTHNGTVTAYGFTGGAYNAYVSTSAPGTIYTKASAATYGDLLIDNGSSSTVSYPSPKYTRIPASDTFATITIKNYAQVLIQSGVTLTSASGFSGGTSNSTLYINSGGTLDTSAVSSLSGSPNITNAGTHTINSSTTLASNTYLYNGGSFSGLTNLTLSGGIFTFTSNTGLSIPGNLTISGATVNHTQEPNGSGTTAARSVYFAVAGDMNISSGSITVDSLGFAYAQGPGTAPGYYAGGANGGDGTQNNYYNGYTPGTSGFGSISAPVTAGSGGNNGCSGGGTVRLDVTGTLTVTGTISSNGQTGDCGEGAGGSIWINAGTLAGSGTIRANGGGTASYGGGAGGGGKISLTYTTRTHNGTVSAYGTTTGSYNGRIYVSAAGTIYTKASSATYGDLTVDNGTNSTTPTTTWYTRIPASETFANVTVKNYAQLLITSGKTLTVATAFTNGTSDATLTINSGGILDTSAISSLTGAPNITNLGTHTVASSTTLSSSTYTYNGAFSGLTNLTISTGGIFSFANNTGLSIPGNLTISGGTVNHTQEPNGTGTTAARAVYFTVSGDMNISSGSVTVTGLGFVTGQGPATGDGTGCCSPSGGGNGGDGAKGNGSGGGLSGIGSITSPVTAGSGAGSGSGSNGGYGGGTIRLDVTGTLTVTGNIVANGSNGGGVDAGAGAGGSIWINAGTLAGAGSITANGGNGGNSSGRGGGGGKISLTYTTRTHNGSVTAYGGSIYDGTYAAAGTIYTKAAAATYGDVAVNNNSHTSVSTAYTRTLSGALTINTLTLSGSGKVSLGNTLTLSGDVSIASGTTLVQNSQNIVVGGNWTNNGTFTNSGLVTFNGSGTSLFTGNTTFTTLTCTTAGKALTFTAGSTQTISGVLTLTGTSGSKIVLRSSATPTRWNINPQSIPSVSYVDIKDSNNSNASARTASTSLDSGNNNNWTIQADCVDSDGDGYGNPGSAGCTHPETDCDDTRASVHPGAREISNGLDDDCDGVRDNNIINQGVFSNPL